MDRVKSFMREKKKLKEDALTHKLHPWRWGDSIIGKEAPPTHIAFALLRGGGRDSRSSAKGPKREGLNESLAKQRQSMCIQVQSFRLARPLGKWERGRGLSGFKLNLLRSSGYFHSSRGGGDGENL